MQASERKTPLETMVRLHIDAALDDVHTCSPAAVTEYDPVLQRCSVKPLIKHGYPDEAGNVQVESLGVVTGVPVLFPGGGGARATFPISDGTLIIPGIAGTLPATTGLLIWAEGSLDRWLSGVGAEVDPGIYHRFAMPDGIFIPGLNPFGAPWKNVPTNRATFGFDLGALLHAYVDHLAVASQLFEDATPSEQTAVRGSEFMADLAPLLDNLAVLLPALVAVATPFMTPAQVTAAAALVAPAPAPGSILTMAVKALAPPATAPGTYQSPNLLLP